MARTSTALSQALLYLEILKRIPRQASVSRAEIQHSLALDGIKVQTLTLQRALKTIVETESLGIEVNDTSRPFSYRQGSTGSGLEAAQLTPQESLVMRLVEENLNYQLPSEIAKGLAPIFAKARQVLNEEAKNTSEREWLKKVAVVPNALRFEPPRILPRIFNTVTEALYQDKMLKLRFHNASGKVKEKNVSPLGLVQQDQRIYLVVQFETYDNFRHIALHRIEEAEILSRSASRPANFSIDAYVRSKPFNYCDDKVDRIRLSFETENKDTVATLRETPFNRTQTITELEKGRWKVEVAEIADSLLLDGWLNTWKEPGKLSRIRKKPIAD